jgi:pimeloyl-ACP methyl ester carboxylesterase
MLSVIDFTKESQQPSPFEALRQWCNDFMRHYQHRSSMTSVFEKGMVRFLRVRGFISHFVPTRSGMIHVMTGAGGGDMAPVVLFHGLASCGAHYTPMMRHLRKEVREIILPDAPGHGQSSTPPDDQCHEVFQDSLNKAVASLITEPAVVFGNSMGGFLGIRFALAYPDKVRALILCSPGGAAMSQPELDSFLGLFRMKSHSDSLDFLNRAFGKVPPFRHIVAWRVRHRFSSKILQQRLDSLKSEDLLSAEELQQLKVPVVLIWGQEDGILPQQCLDFFQEHLPDNTRVIEPSQYGHAPFVRHAKSLAGHIVDLLAELRMESRWKAHWFDS